jgi:phosphoribosylaminoimidazole-succinocarboxamide synthase
VLTQQQLIAAIPEALQTVDLPELGAKQSGKVRDMYALPGGRRLLITTDRISAFDVVLGTIPYKGQTLNQLSAFWFDRTRDILQNHMLVVPDPNVMIAREARTLPVEVVVRGFITGVTKTSLWTLYAAGERSPYGIVLPDGLKKNDALPKPIITPTTKAEAGGHDERLTRAEIIGRGLLPEALWLQIEHAAVALFLRGQEIARKAGLILVDTKYEFGLIDGQLAVIDEMHTPDSSRFWTLESYESDPTRPRNFDKEFLREWYAARGYRGDGAPPPMTHEFIAQVAERYIAAFERLTGREFVPAETPAAARIRRSWEQARNAGSVISPSGAALRDEMAGGGFTPELARRLFLPAPELTLDAAARAHFASLFARGCAQGVAQPLDCDGGYPKSDFLRYLVQHHDVLLHGTTASDLTELAPRPQGDYNGNPVTAVFASSDGIWPQFFAIIDRLTFDGSMRNGCFVLGDGAAEDRHYFFSVNDDWLRRQCWTTGTIYVLPRATFRPADTSAVRFDEWTSKTAVKPLFKVTIAPDDFPFLSRVSGHSEIESIFDTWLNYKKRVTQ